jgi:hypothetical protein
VALTFAAKRISVGCVFIDFPALPSFKPIPPSAARSIQHRALSRLGIRFFSSSYLAITSAISPIQACHKIDSGSTLAISRAADSNNGPEYDLLAVSAL